MISSEIQQFEKYYALLTEYLVTYSMQIVGAIFILLIGLWVAKKLAEVVANLMTRHNVDITLTNFVSNVVKVLLIIMVIIIALGKIGISVTPFVAAIGVVTLSAATEALSCDGTANKTLNTKATSVALIMPILQVTKMSKKFFRICINC